MLPVVLSSNILYYWGFYLYTHHGLCPVLWTVCRCARWGNPQHCHGSDPLLACRSLLQVQLWSWHTLQTPSCQTSPPTWPAVCSSPGLSASRCSPDQANILHQYCQNLAVVRKTIERIKVLCECSLKSWEQLVWMSVDDSGSLLVLCISLEV